MASTSLLPRDGAAQPQRVSCGKAYPSATLAAQADFVVSIPGLTAGSIVIAMYIHPLGGGAGQWIWSITPGTNQCVFKFGAAVGAQSSSALEYIIWEVLQY